MLSPTQAKRKSDQWAHDFDDWRSFTGVKSWRGWDSADATTRHRLEMILECGYELVTQEKIGRGPFTDDEIMEIVRRRNTPVRRRRR